MSHSGSDDEQQVLEESSTSQLLEAGAEEELQSQSGPRKSQRQITLSLKAAENKMIDLTLTLVRMINNERANLENIFQILSSDDHLEVEDLRSHLYSTETAKEKIDSVLCEIRNLCSDSNKMSETLSDSVSQYQTEVKLAEQSLQQQLDHAHEESERMQALDAEMEAKRRILEEEIEKFNRQTSTHRQKIQNRPHITQLTNHEANGRHTGAVRDASPESSISARQAPDVTSPAPSSMYNESSINRLADKIEESIKFNHRAIIEPKVFEGDPLEFAEWEDDFDSFMKAQGVKDPVEKLRFLKKYIEGEALEFIAGQFRSKTEASYLRARRKLTNRYGNTYDVTTAMREKLDKWPMIKANDGKGLQKFADYLDQVSNTMSSMPGLEILDSYQENEKLTDKLPDWAARKWTAKVREHKTAKKGYPKFTEFACFVADEAEILMEPLLRRRSENATPDKRSHYRTSSMATVAESKPCLFCEKDNHKTAHCFQLGSQPFSKRLDFFATKRLCYSCASQGHSSNECPNREHCRRCKRPNHPTCLHKSKEDWESYPPNKPKGVEHTQTSKPDDRGGHVKLDTKTTNAHVNLALILPVKVSAKNKPQQEFTVYALMDGGSDSTYISRDLAKRLNLNGIKRNVSMTTMIGESEPAYVNRYTDINIEGISNGTKLSISAYEWNNITCDRRQIPHPENVGNIPHLRDHAHRFFPLMDIPIAMLVGRDFPDAHKQFERIESVEENKPFAARTIFGWGVIGGESSGSQPRSLEVHAVSAILSNMDENSTISQDDIKFLDIMEKESTHLENGQIQMPLPFKERPILENNREQAERRLIGLQKRFNKDCTFKTEYLNFMEDLINKGHAEPVTSAGKAGEVWYIPHFAVRHPKKKKLRVVFDCSAKSGPGSTSLNQQLLQGPDLLNSLLGMLCRFRKEETAIACDIEKMFYNFLVEPADRDYLRFLWIGEGNTIKDYRMTVHLFGATSSPGAATFGLRRLAAQHASRYPEAAKFIMRNFYVDDGITSVANADGATQLIADARKICSAGNIRLHKFVSNNQTVMDSIPKSERAENFDLFSNVDSTQRTLGLEWAVDSDTLRFNKEVITPKPATRRGILSVVSQLFDPLGFICPFTMIGKNILQKVNAAGIEWDEPVPQDIGRAWTDWIEALGYISEIIIPRCVKPTNFGLVKRTELHHFSDASSTGMGACSYLRLIDDADRVHVSLLIAKARVIPSKETTTIPRLELQAAVIASHLSATLGKEMDMKVDKEYFWSDSTIALGYIANTSKRFYMYVANRVFEILKLTRPDMWHHVPGEVNPADIASRGMDCQALQSSVWYKGPKFLQTVAGLEKMIEQDKLVPRKIQDDDKEVRKSLEVNSSQLTPNSMYHRLTYFGDFKALTRAFAKLKFMAKVAKNKHSNSSDGNLTNRKLSTEDLSSAERLITRITQQHHYHKEIFALKSKGRVTRDSKLSALSPFLDSNKILRVGGRLKQSAVLSYNEMHPVIFPANSHLAILIINNCHEKVFHQGRGITTAAIRKEGYWIVGGTTAIKSVLHQCITCRKLRAAPEEQIMADLPVERVNPSPPFSSIGIDCFGPFTVKDYRSERKRWGLLATCLYSRAVHVELLQDMTMDSLINALRNLISIRGPVTMIRCDQGTNLVGAHNELSKALLGIDDSTAIGKYFKAQQITFKFNAPHASHSGGVWERQIRNIRSVLNGMTSKFKGRLDTESLRTAFYEAMATVNSRPLAVDSLADPTANILTPNHLLTMKSKSPTAPSTFTDTEVYGRKMWRKVQQFADEFWSNWKSAYLKEITVRQKWHQKKRNITRGDVVLLIDDNQPRGEWSTAIVEDTTAGSDGNIRSVKVRLANQFIDRFGKEIKSATVLERPIQKLVLLLPSSDSTKC